MEMPQTPSGALDWPTHIKDAQLVHWKPFNKLLAPRISRLNQSQSTTGVSVQHAVESLDCSSPCGSGHVRNLPSGIREHEFPYLRRLGRLLEMLRQERDGNAFGILHQRLWMHLRLLLIQINISLLVATNKLSSAQ